MRPGYGEQLIAEGDVEIPQEHEELVAEFRRQLDAGMWAAVPTTGRTGRREARMVQAFEQIRLQRGRFEFAEFLVDG